MKVVRILNILGSILVVALVVFLSTGCTPRVSQNMDFDRIMPQELADCKVFELRTQGGRDIYVVRCGNSVSTQYRTGGKSSVDVQSSTIDDRYPPR